MEIKLEINGYEHAQDLMDAYPERVKNASRRAINRTARGVESDSSRTLAKTYTISRRDIKPAIRKTLAKAQQMFAQVDFSSIEVCLDKFKHSPTTVASKRPKIGVKVWIKKGSSIIHKGSFLASLTKGENDKPRIYERKGKERFPLTRSKWTSVSEMIEEIGVNDLQLSAKERFFKAFAHEMIEGFKHSRGKR